MTRHYLPTRKGEIVCTVGEQAIVLTLDEARSSCLPLAEEMAAQSWDQIPGLAEYWAADLADLRWAIGEAEARRAEKPEAAAAHARTPTTPSTGALQ